jgi:hypothetical protein
MIIPRVGDYWEFKCPGKSKKVKEIGDIRFRWFEGKWDASIREFTPNHHRIFIWWDRRPKGRYSGIRPKVLLKYGRRISTKAERDAHFQAQVEARRAKVRAARQQSGQPDPIKGVN